MISHDKHKTMQDSGFATKHLTEQNSMSDATKLPWHVTTDSKTSISNVVKKERKKIQEIFESLDPRANSKLKEFINNDSMVMAGYLKEERSKVWKPPTDYKYTDYRE